jgi:hypothetical protein
VGPLSFTFNECSYTQANGSRSANVKVSPELEAEEIILRNTFMNAKMGPFPTKDIDIGVHQRDAS